MSVIPRQRDLLYQDIFVVQGLAKLLLGCPAIDALAIDEPVMVTTPQVHRSFQTIPRYKAVPYTILLSSDAQPTLYSTYLLSIHKLTSHLSHCFQENHWNYFLSE